jgi:hypothetical protein
LTRLASKHRGPLLPHPRQRVRLVRSRAPSIDRLLPKSSLSRTVFGGNPPPVSRLCRRGPGFRRAFATPMLSPGVARPDVGSRGSSPRVATGRTPPVDFCNLHCDPRAHPTDRPNPAHRAGGRPPAQLSFRATVFRRRNGLRVAVRFTAQPIERSRARGLLSGDSPIERHGSSRRDRSRWELHPNPIGSDTSCRGLVATPAGVAVAVGSLLEETG